jgi:Sec-independent protein translocase protein TatA
MDSFFGIGLPELLLILIVAGIVMGPERIGVAARWLGRTSSQLQAVSRSFMRQINSELDGLEGTSAVKETVREMKDLQGELAQLKRELLSLTGDVSKDGKQLVAQTRQELERTIAPDSYVRDDARPVDAKPADEPVVSAPLAPEELPQRVAVADDPE